MKKIPTIMKFLCSVFCLLVLTVFSCLQANSQNKITVSGIVLDKDTRAPLGGVTIQAGIPSKNIGLTNENGKFSVSINPGQDLAFSYAGYNVSRHKASTFVNSGTLEVTMETKKNSMDEVVVQGFRGRTRDVSTGSSTVLSGQQVQDIPVSNVMELLQGKVAGLNIQNNSGTPGGMGTINLRGLSSINITSDGFLTPTSPLFIVDGVPIDANSGYEYGFQSGGIGVNPLALIPPEDIEQFDVLRDAAATSQYGSRGAYGVILITTRRGKSKVPRVEYSTNFFIKTPPKLREVIGGKEERSIRINTILAYDTSLNGAYSAINNASFLSDSLNPYYNNNTNWQKYFYRTTLSQQHNLSILGGDTRFNYKTNLNYYNEQGIIINTGYRRYGLNMQAQYSPTDAFKMLATLNGSMGQQLVGSGSGLLQTGLGSSANASSLLPPPSLFSENNAALSASVIENKNKKMNISSSLDIQYEPLKGLRFGNLLTFGLITGTTLNFTPSYLNLDRSKSYNANDHTNTIYDRSTVGYNINVANVHSFGAYLFNELQSVVSRTNIVQLIQTASDQIQGPIGYNRSLSVGGVLDNLSTKKIHGYGASFSYNYDKKYVLEFNYRLDGTSVNGPNRPYSENPSVSARWNFFKENFFEKVPWLSSGSIRASWGKNITPIGNIFDIHGRYQIGLPYNNNSTVTINSSVIPNQSFLPETKTESNIALEFSLFNNRIDATVESYYKSIDNQALDIGLPNFTGFSTLKTNDLSLVNYGTEVTLRARITNDLRKPFQWTVSFTGELRRDVLTKLPGGLRQFERTINDPQSGQVSVPIVHKIGRNAISNLLYYTSGIYNSTADVPVNIATGLRQQLGSTGSRFYFQGGDPKWADINGDYVINSEDMQPIGNPIPRATGGIYSQMTYKNFSLNVQVSYTLLRDVLNTSLSNLLKSYSNPFNLVAVLPVDNFKIWKPSEKDHSVGQGNAVYPNPYDFRRSGILDPFRSNQTLFMEDGSYWKINNIVLAYSFSKNFNDYPHLGMA